MELWQIRLQIKKYIFIPMFKVNNWFINLRRRGMEKIWNRIGLSDEEKTEARKNIELHQGTKSKKKLDYSYPQAE